MSQRDLKSRDVLSESHLKMLELESGISPEIIQERGYFTATEKSELADIGFPPSQQLVPALVIPHYWIDGQVSGYQIRPDKPRVKRGRTLKYETREGRGNFLDILPSSIPKLLDPNVPLWITEGAKKADAFASAYGACVIPLTGVWNFNGENSQGGIAFLPSWRDVPFKSKSGSRRVYIAYDSDIISNPHVAAAANALRELLLAKEADPMIIVFPTDGRKVAMDDWVVAGNTLEQLLPYARQVAPHPPTKSEVLADGPRIYDQTDLGNARRLVDKFGNDFRWVEKWKSWLVWDGRRWQKDEKGGAGVYQRVHQMLDDMKAEAASILAEDTRKKAMVWAEKSQGHRAIESMVREASRAKGIPVAPEELDSDPWLITVQNGTIDLRTCEILDHDRSHLITKLADATYDEDAACPRWEQFLTEIFGDDVDMLRFIWQICGYVLTGSVEEKCLFYFYGPQGNNGKTVFIETLMGILGDYSRQSVIDAFLAKPFANDGPTGQIARLAGARFVSIPEVPGGKKLNTQLLKDLTGGDTVTASFKYSQEFEYKSQMKLFMVGNGKVTITETTDAWWERLYLVPFTISIPPERRDPALASKLRAERDGILNWMVEGLKLYHEKPGKRLTIPATIKEAVQEYRLESDEFGAFLADKTIKGDALSVGGLVIYKAYETWAKENGINPMKNPTFAKIISERGYQKKRTNQGIVYVGIDVKSDGEDGQWWSDK